MHRSIIVIDNFLNDPEYFRSTAREMDYPILKEQSNFPGRNSFQRLEAPDVDNAIANIVGESLVPLTQLSHNKFRLTLKNDEGKAKVHLDNSQWSAILYLSKEGSHQSGTDFYRHRDTGLDSALLSQSDFKKLGWDDSETANQEINKILEKDTNDSSKWEHIMRVPMKYNRLLLMRPWLWHTAGPGFGNSFENGRLVYLLFYSTPQNMPIGY